MKKALLISTVILVLASGCCPKAMKSLDYRDSVRIEYRDRYRDRVMRDTAYVRDSIVIREKGDTVTIYRDRYHYVNRYVKDTVNITDTVFVELYKDRVEVIEKKHIPAFFWWALVVAVASCVYFFMRILKRFK